MRAYWLILLGVVVFAWGVLRLRAPSGDVRVGRPEATAPVDGGNSAAVDDGGGWSECDKPVSWTFVACGVLAVVAGTLPIGGPQLRIR